MACDPNVLIDQARCIEACVPPGMMQAVQVAALCALGTTVGEYDSFRYSGTTANRWYGASNSVLNTGGNIFATITLPTAVILAFPLIVPKGGTIGRMSFRVSGTGTAGNTARIGLYNNTDQNTLYPSTLIFDSGPVATDALAVYTFPVNASVLPGTLYWAVIFGSGGGPTIASLNPATIAMVIGFPDNTFTSNPPLGWTVAATYGALPSTYPVGGTTYNGAAGSQIPAILYQVI